MNGGEEEKQKEGFKTNAILLNLSVAGTVD